KDSDGKPVDYENELMETETQRWSLLQGRDPVAAEALLDDLMARLDRLPPERAADPVMRRTRAVVLANRGIHNQTQRRFVAAEADYDAAVRELDGVGEVKDAAFELARVEVNRSAFYLDGSRRGEGREEDLAKAARAGKRAIASLRKILKGNPQDV